MPKCPKCFSEYRDGFSSCGDRGAQLVDGLGFSAENAPEYRHFAGEVFLANISDIVELSYVTSMLDEAGIPYRMISEDIGQYLHILHGQSFFGRNIYVDKNDCAQAMKIMESYRADILADQVSDISEDLPSEHGMISQAYKLIILIHFATIPFGMML